MRMLRTYCDYCLEDIKGCNGTQHTQPCLIHILYFLILRQVIGYIQYIAMDLITINIIN